MSSDCCYRTVWSLESSFPLLWFCNTGTKGAFPARLPGLVVTSLSARRWMLSPDSVALVHFLSLQAESEGWGDEGELDWQENSW